MPRHRPCLLLALAAAGLSPGCLTPQRVVEVRVERDGQVVLRGSLSVPASATPADGWYQLEGKPLRAAGPIAPEPDDPGAAVLKGELRVALTHDGKPFVTSQLDRLRVVRVPGSDDLWEIPREELERATKPALRPGFEKKGPHP